jgi:hypothetical protein
MTNVWGGTIGSSASFVPTCVVAITLDGSNQPLAVGATNLTWVAPLAGNLKGWSLALDSAGSIEIDIWKAYDSLPVLSNSITSSTPPSATGDRFSSSTTLSGWTTSFVAGDVFTFNIDSVSGVTHAVLTLLY